MAKILSIEVGYALTRICEMDYRSKNPKVYKYFNVPTPQGAISDGFLADNEDFVAVIKDALAEHKVKTKQVVFSITSSKIATREVMVPMVKASQMDAMVKANASDYFPIDLTEYELAHLILGVEKGEDKTDRYKVLVMAAGKSLIAGYERFAAQLGLRLTALDYAGSSVYQLMKAECSEDTEMIIKIEERSTNALVISNQSLVLQRNIVYGIDEAVQILGHGSEHGEVGYREVLELLRRKTCIKVALSPETRIIEADDDIDNNPRIAEAKRRLTESLAPFVGNVARVVDLYNSKNVDNPIKRVRIVGLGGDISGLSKLFTNELGIQTTVMGDLEYMDLSRAEGEGSPGLYVACFGAAIAPVGFINEDKKKQDAQATNYRNVAILSGIFFVLASAALCALSIMRYNDAKSEQQRLARLEAEYGPAEAVYNTYNQIQIVYKEVENGLKVTSGPNDNLIAFLEELEQKLPATAELTEFSSNEEQAVLTIMVEDKEQAAKIIQTLRAFDCVMDVSIGSVDREDVEKAAAEAAEDVEELGEPRVLFSIICTYYPTIIEDVSQTQTPQTSQPVDDDLSALE
ncbi:MAG: pilus assembly protein PilM [Lachnospiraceae bacterium]|nr:pilus assembly protein PilM [Lachnospiraceae bacterium]